MNRECETGPYLYQPFGCQDTLFWNAGRIYGIGGLGTLSCIRGLTKPEAEAVLAALQADRERNQPAQGQEQE